MSFQPSVNETIHINGNVYMVGEHPNVPGIPYGQEGRQGTVYLLYSEDKRQKMALKVFRTKFINPSMSFQTQQISKFSGMAGLSACERTIITPQLNTTLLHNEPDLLYAVLMPWIDGPTWMDVLLNKQPLTKKQSYSAAYALAHALVAMEQRGLAHCDLSGPNVILPLLFKGKKVVTSLDYVQLIDLEQMYGAQLEKPEYIPLGSPGYGPQNKTQTGMWGPNSDRFAAAVLFMEMLGSCSDVFYEQACGESFFAPDELQSNCERLEALLQAVGTNWGNDIVSLFARAWESDELNHCPTFGEWMIEIAKLEHAVLDQTVSMPVTAGQPKTVSAAKPKVGNANEALLKQARDLEAKGKFKEAIGVYRSIQSLEPHSALSKEIEIAIEMLEKKADKGKKKSKQPSPDRNSKLPVLFKALAKTALAAVILVAVGAGGYYGYLAVKDSDLFKPSAEAPVTKEALAEANSKIKSLTDELKERDNTIAQLNKKMEAQSKPLSQKQSELYSQLNDDYKEIKKIAASDTNGYSEAEKKAYGATAVYMKHYFDFIIQTYNLDQQFVDQTNVVEGYYFPYKYNENRNPQLNIQFFKDYKGKF